MKSRISSIMDIARKRRGTIILCTALLLIIGTGLIFAVNSTSTPEDPALPDRPPSTGYEDDLTHVSSPPPSNPGITFVFQKEMPLSMEPLPLLDEKNVNRIITEESIGIDGIVQGFYRNNNSDLPYNIYSFIEIGGIKYDIGQITYGEDNTLSLSPYGYLLYHFRHELTRELDASGESIYQQQKSYGTKYDAVAYYIIVDDVPIFLTEISGVVEYIDIDSSGVSSILSTDRSLPYTECYVNKLDLRNKVLHFTNLTELLKCDSVYYNIDTGLYLTHHKPVDPSQDSPVEGFVYSFDNGIFIQVDIITHITFEPKEIRGLDYASFAINDGQKSLFFRLDDKDSLKWLEDNFGSAVVADYESSCPFWAAMYLYRRNGTLEVIYPALDGCNTFLSGDVQYTWGKGGNEAFFALFGATDYESLLSMEYPTTPPSE